MDESQEILRAIGRLEGKVDAMLEDYRISHTQDIDRMNRIDEDIEGLRTEVYASIDEISDKVHAMDKKQYAIIIIFMAFWTLIAEGIKTLIFK